MGEEEKKKKKEEKDKLFFEDFKFKLGTISVFIVFMFNSYGFCFYVSTLSCSWYEMLYINEAALPILLCLCHDEQL